MALLTEKVKKPVPTQPLPGMMKPTPRPGQIQPSARPNQPFGNQMMKSQLLEPTGVAPGRLVSSAVREVQVAAATPPARLDPTSQVDTNFDSPGPAAQPSERQPARQPGMLAAPTSRPSERVQEIISAGGPLMQQAETHGKQYAQSRGLLNSSLGAQASQAAVLDRAIPLAQSDVQSEINNFYASLDMDKYESDVDYRNRALEQERNLQDRKLALDTTLGHGQLDVNQRNLALQKEQQEFYRGLDQQRMETDEAYRRDMKEQERQIQDRRASLDEELGRAGVEQGARRLDQNQQGLDQQKKQQDFYQNLDREKFLSDDAYRNNMMEQDSFFRTQSAERDMLSLGIQLDGLRLSERTTITNQFMQVDRDTEAAIAAIMSNPDMQGPARTNAINAAVQRGKTRKQELSDLHGDQRVSDFRPEDEDIQAPQPEVPEPAPEKLAEQEKEIGRWGWVYRGNGKWHHAGSDASGHWQGSVFVNEKENKYYDPGTGEVHDMPGG